MAKKINKVKLSLLKHTDYLPKSTKFYCDALCCRYLYLPPNICYSSDKTAIPKYTSLKVYLFHESELFN